MIRRVTAPGWLTVVLLWLLVVALAGFWSPEAQAEPRAQTSPLPMPAGFDCQRTETPLGFRLDCLALPTSTPTSTSTPLPPTSTPTPTSTATATATATATLFPTWTPAVTPQAKWYGSLAGFNVFSDTITVTGGGILLWSQRHAADQGVSVTIKQLDRTSNELGLILLSQYIYHAGKGSIEIEYVPRLGLLRVWQNANGQWVRIGADVQLALAAGDTFAATVITDTLVVYVNGKEVLTRLLDPWRFDPSGGGYAGIATDAGKHVLSGFEAQSLTP